jgi:hypothetical protein
MDWLPGSEILKKLIPDPDPGVKKAPVPGSKSAAPHLSTKSAIIYFKALQRKI